MARRKRNVSAGKGPTTRNGSRSAAGAPDIYAPATTVLTPKERPLKVYAFDPSAGRMLGNEMTVRVPYEPLMRGPVGERFAVIDYDGAAKTYYTPVDLEDPKILLRGGIDPTESDPRFHQQMVYAVASETLQRFETALGRKVGWRRPSRGPKRDAGQVPIRHLNRLGLYPHAMAQANAFYTPDAHAILFGYFTASQADPGANLPGQTVFTCLSHDIIAHETTHAVVDGIRSYLMEATNPDVAAFHEAFADVAALFRHFSHPDVLIDTLQKTGGQLFDFQLQSESGGSAQPAIQTDLARPNPLIQLAQQFGEAVGMRGGLRSALGTPPNSDAIKSTNEPHARGAILVAGIFDAYFTVYLRRTADLFRVFRAGGGAARPVDLPGPLAHLLAEAASRTAEQFFTLCARSLDYCPPVDLTFGDFLRALITAHVDLSAEDPDGVRDALMQAFRLRGIVTQGARFFSEDALCWSRVETGALPPVSGLAFGDPSGLDDNEKNLNGRVLRGYAGTNARQLGFDLDVGPISAPSFHPVFRVGANGALNVDMVVELVQTYQAPFDANTPRLGTFPMRSGVTLLIAQPPVDRGQRPDPVVRFAIAKHRPHERERSQRAHYKHSGLSGNADGTADFKINFGLIHAGL
jgi:hypothetical protein